MRACPVPVIPWRCRQLASSLLDHEKVKGDGSEQNNYGRDPPNRFHSSRFVGGAEFALDEFIVIEIFVRQIKAVMAPGVVAPTGIVIGSA